jgi:hypothetical protein
MFFISNTEKQPEPDSIGDLFGRGIRADLIANSYDWGEKLIDRPNFPAGPYDPKDSVIILKNGGSMPVTIRRIIRVSNINGNAFLFNEASLTGVVIPDSSQLYVPVRFQPKVTGDHELIIEYDNTASTDPNSLPRSTLRGIGVVPRIKTVDLTFDTTVVGNTAHPSIRTLRISLMNKSEWQYTFDSVTISDLLIKPNGNEIATDLTTFGSQGFRYNKAALNLSKVLKLDSIPTDSYVEFDAEFVAPSVLNPFLASLTTQSNAETEVTSNWTGFGKDMSLVTKGGNAQVCEGMDQTIVCNVSNVGTDDVLIDSVVIVPLNANSKGTVFTFVNSADANGFSLTMNGNRDIPILYTSKRDAANNLPLTQHSAMIYFYWLKNDTLRVDSCRVDGTTEYHQRQTVITLPVTKIRVDDDFEAVIGLKSLSDVPLTTANITALDVRFTYNGTILKILDNGIMLGSTLQGKWQKNNVVIKDIPGVVTLTLTGNEIFDYARINTDAELMKLRFHTYLPKDSNKTSDVKFSIVPSNGNKTCLGIDSCGGSITLEDVCKFDLRKVVISSTTYALKAVNPNPVTTDKAQINFSIGWDGYTEIKLYNSNSELIAMPVKSDLQKGEYTIDLDVSNLPSGVYWYEMKAGPYHKMEKMVVVQ